MSDSKEKKEINKRDFPILFVRLDKDLHRKVKIYAATVDKSMTEVGELAIKQYMEDK